MYNKPWLLSEVRTLRLMWAAGIDAREIATVLPGRSRDALYRYATHIGLARPRTYKPPRPHENWDQVHEVLSGTEHGMTAAQIARHCKVNSSVIYKLLNNRHGKIVYVCDWLVTTRKPAAIWALGTGPDALSPVLRRDSVRLAASPFAVAAGVVTPPRTLTGRTYTQSMSIRDEEEMSA